MKRVSLLFFLTIFFLTTNAQDKKMLELVNTSLKKAIDASLMMAKSLEKDTAALPKTFENNRLITANSRWWTSGFFPGVLWYLYESNRSEELRKYAELYSARVEREKYTTDNHDVGFMLYCSFGNGLRILGKEEYKEVLLTGSKSLATRYDPKVGLIRSWDWNKHIWQYPVIIDNMMNLEMLIWAAKNSGNMEYKNIAVSHANKTMAHHFRPDYSTYHLVSYDTTTGNPHLKQTVQGYTDNSSWARGQGWAVYGYSMMYRETGDEKYLNQAEKVAQFIIKHPNLPKDGIPYWDFDAPNTPSALRDASAGALIASALIELSQASKDNYWKKKYLSMAETQIKTLSSPQFLSTKGANGNFILKHSVGSLPGKSEVDVPLTYADYYFVEALVRYKNYWKSHVGGGKRFK